MRLRGATLGVGLVLLCLSACSSPANGPASPSTSAPSSAASGHLPGGAERSNRIVLANIQPDDGVGVVVDFIASAKHTLDIGVYQIDPLYGPIVDALKAAQQRGVKVRLLISGTIFPMSADNLNPQIAEDLRAQGIDTQLSRPEFSFSHWKVLIADSGTSDGRALVCDYNLERGYFGLDPEYPDEGVTRGMAVLDTDPADVEMMAKTFDADWPPYKPWPANTRPNLVWSPSDDTCDSVSCTGPFPLQPTGNSKSVMIDLINSATTSLDVYVQALASPSALLQPLLDAAHRGVNLRILGNQGGINDDAAAQLTAAGAQIRQNPTDPSGDGKVMYIHTKTVIADSGKPDGVAYVGSVNPFLDESLDTERELGILLTDPSSIARIVTTFDRDFNSASGQSSASPS